MATFKDLKGVEIFRVGRWKNEEYQLKDLQSIVEAYDKVGFKPPVTSGHQVAPGLPALGWIENLRCENGRLLADFNQLYPEVYEALKNRRYTSVSSEIYINYKQQDGTILPKVLRAVALLGQDVPAVKDLKPLHELIHTNNDTLAEKFEMYESNLEFEITETKEFSAGGIKFVVGRLKGAKTTTVQTILFSKASWTVDGAKAWLKKHDMYADKVDIPEDGTFIRFRQRDPSDFIEGSFRTIEPSAKAASCDDLYKVYEDLITIEREGRKMELEEKIKELEDKLAKVIGFKEGEIKELNAKVTELTNALEAAKGEAKKFSETDSGKKVLQLQKQLEDTNAQLEASMRKFAETEKKKADLEESQRKERIERKVKDLKFPALRPYIEVFYEVSTKGENATSVMKFSADGSASKELTVERIVDGLISTLNRLAENKLFSEMSTIPEFRRDDLLPSDDPREETDKRVREYCAKHNMDYVKDYSIAMKAVFVEDPKLKELYSAS